MGEKSKGAWHYFSVIELFLLPVRFSLLQYFLWENTAIIRWPPPLLPLICCLSFHELGINVSRQFYLFKDFLNVTEYSEVEAKNYCSLRTHDCRFKFETQVAATTNGFILTSKYWTTSSPHFSSGMAERAKRERAWKSPHARKARRGSIPPLSPLHLAFLVWGDFHARSRFARSVIPEEKSGSTRSLLNNRFIN